MSDGLQLALTPRQTDIARHIARGLDPREIASLEGISIWAVRAHLYGIADKLDNPKMLTPLRLVRQWAITQPSLRDAHGRT